MLIACASLYTFVRTVCVKAVGMYITFVSAGPTLVYVFARNSVVIETSMADAFIRAHSICAISMFIAHVYSKFTFIYVEAVVSLVTMITFAKVGTYDVYTSRILRAGIIARGTLINI